jgi:RNA polymerase sigma-70 factor (ECF subfamily)
MEWITTSTILRNLCDDDDAAWQQFVARFQRPVSSFARGVGLSAVDAEDVAQETLLAFVEGFRHGKYDPAKGRLSRWLFGIAHRQILQERRRGARREATVPPPTGPGTFWGNVPDEREVSNAWDAEWEQSLMGECIERARREFEPQTFRAFELAVQGTGSTTEVARELDVPVKTVYNAKHRVLKRIRELRQQLEELD